MHVIRVDAFVIPMPATTASILRAILESGERLPQSYVIDYLFEEKIVHAVRYALRECFGTVKRMKLDVVGINGVVKLKITEVEANNIHKTDIKVLVDPYSHSILIENPWCQENSGSKRADGVELVNGYIRKTSDGYEAVFYA